MDIIGKKYFYFAVSLFVLVPGVVAFLIFGLKLSIEFTGGTNITASFPKAIEKTQVNTLKNELTSQKIKIVSSQQSDNILILHTSPLTQEQDNKFVNTLSKLGGKQESLETIGPTIGEEITQNAIKAIALASVLIILYITWAFRSVPKPASSFRFGVCAIAALVHDVLVVIGVFAILGHFFNIEVDSMFVTALLTIIGFSVHDTIVVFDRIRENLKRFPSLPFDKVVNESILQTFDRSLNTSLTVVLVLFAMLLFGGESIRWFVVALLVGIVSGTYSSIFNAAPLLVLWQQLSNERKKIKKV